MDTTITFVIEFLFTLVFVASLRDYMRRRDPVSRDLVLVFGAVAALFAVQFIRIVFGSVAPVLAAASAAMIFAQPLFTLRLAARLRPIPRSVTVTVLIGYLVTAIPVVVVGRPVPVPMTLAAVGVFAFTELLAAIFIGMEARRRTGATRFRLALAAAATALFAVALLVVGGGAAGTVPGGADLARLVAFLAAVGYAVAFLPPGPLRRVWQGMAAYRYGLALLGTPGVEPDAGRSDAVWQRFAQAAREIAGAEAAAIIALDGNECRVLTSVGLAADRTAQRWPREAYQALLKGARVDTQIGVGSGSEIMREIAEGSGARLASVVTLPPGDGAALILLSRHHSLFGLEDRGLIRLLAAQAAALAEREALYARQSRLAEQLFAASQAKSDFIASMSHELRTPLSAILGFSELMQTEEQQGDRRVVPIEWIDHIHRGGQHLLGLINDVLDLAKVEAGRLDLDRSPFDLRGLVTETVSGLRPLAERKALAVQVEGDVEWLVADRGRVRQVLYNLVSNAIKFTPDGGRITLGMVAEPGIVRLSVSDTGPGISPEDQAVIFDEFRQVGGVGRTQEGTGLGLALARRLVEAHGGQLELESEVGVGSRFTAGFPQPDEPNAEPGRAGAGQAAVVAGSDPATADVLVIENDLSTVRLLRTYLAADGYAVRVAQDAATGLAQARAHRPAAIILDIILPDADGWEVLRELKADPGLRDVPVIIVTVVDERGLGLALGAVDYFLKPVDRKALLDRLGRYTVANHDRSPIRVLAVDDDPVALDLIEAALVPEGYAVVRATGGREAVGLALTERFDIVVCDLVMPDVDGFDVVVALKADPRSRAVPILILTAHVLNDREKARLGDQILGIVEKGDDAVTGLHAWLARTLRSVGATGADAP